MELIIRFDENKAEDIKAAREVLNQLEGQTLQRTSDKQREQLWEILDRPVPREISSRRYAKFSASGVTLIGDLVRLPETDQVFKHGENRAVTPIRYISRELKEIDPRLHLFMTDEETLGWIRPSLRK